MFDNGSRKHHCPDCASKEKMNFYIMKKLIIFLTLISILTSCSIMLKPDSLQKEKLLFKHLKSWDEFRIEGIIEANYKSFAFRKNIIIRKNTEAFRIDIFDSGIMGLKPSPFISAYMDSVFVLRMPQEFEFIEADDLMFKKISIIFDLEKIYDEKDQIIKNGSLVIGDSEIFFSKKMKIRKIAFPQMQINFHYNDELEFMSIEQNNKEIANIQIDKITHENIRIQKPD
ncbi:MAG: hypothetical protein K8R49_08660 [Candidatus Cloacimonetes bacterium]|nr:hypothetical protein [Candidatus Cloacimonadota bacterium]